MSKTIHQVSAIVFALITTTTSYAQTNDVVWAPRVDLNESMPQSVRYFESKTDLLYENGVNEKFNAFCVIADLSKGEVAVRAVLSTPLDEPTDIAKELGTKVYTTINGGVFRWEFFL
ncbi:hypothetical protein [Reichenbachiella sp. MSK19-1]|uniref:hypothetical protein n=1 Tax=Reichenbachiella sp. MSK19-1 TaxID=1897631 RepID=UPI0011C41C3E|nr:hypothetical protein [Reichenbachiella sp. MSK19-1]